MKKRILILFVVFSLIFAFAGCDTSDSKNESDIVDIIVEEEIIIEGDGVVSNESVVSSNVSEQISSNETAQSSAPSSSTEISSSEDAQEDDIYIDYDWKNNSDNYKLLAFTFDDGPSANTQDYINLFASYKGAATFFVNGRNISSSSDYSALQTAIKYGWDIGNHGENHLVATIGGANGGEATYDEIKNDITTLTHKLESNLKKIDGTPYDVSFYRPPNIKPTANTFKICGEENLAVIWLSQDSYDWDKTKDTHSVFASGLTSWKDGDIILCHEVGAQSGESYKALQQFLPELYNKGYRFCSISELMKLRGITLDQISGELNNVDGNNGMVTNIIEAAQKGKK